MHILIAAEGTSMQSRVARKFSRAAFVLEVNLESRSISSSANTALAPKRRLLRDAAERGVDTIIAGRMGQHARAAAAIHRVHVALAPGLLIEEALQRFLEGSLTILEATAADSRGEGVESILPQSRREHRRHVGTVSSRSHYGDSTPRGRHHLQQFAGRGH